VISLSFTSDGAIRLEWRKSLLAQARVTCLLGCLLLATPSVSLAAQSPGSGSASWYGEEHRGKLMANGKRFDPDQLTAASWFYPLSTKVRVTLAASHPSARSVVVSITDRGPAPELVRGGRIIDLSHAAFQQVAPPHKGIVLVTVQALGREE
jgi:rare lipoprotein A